MAKKKRNNNLGKKLKLITSSIFFLSGLYFILVPHSIQIKFLPMVLAELSHPAHIIIGFLLIITSILGYYSRNV